MFACFVAKNSHSSTPPFKFLTEPLTGTKAILATNHGCIIYQILGIIVIYCPNTAAGHHSFRFSTPLIFRSGRDMSIIRKFFVHTNGILEVPGEIRGLRRARGNSCWMEGTFRLNRDNNVRIKVNVNTDCICSIFAYHRR